MSDDAPAVAPEETAENETLTREKLEAFRISVDTQVAALRELLTGYQAANRKVAGYGAPARVSTICNYGRIGPSLIAAISGSNTHDRQTRNPFWSSVDHRR